MADVDRKFNGDAKSAPKAVEVPDVLMHLVGHMDGNPENHDDDAPAPDEDYIVSGTAVCKALSVFLGNNVTDMRRASRDVLRPGEDRIGTPDLPAAKSTGVKAMSMNMLDSARKIRSRLQPALARECVGGDEMNLSALPKHHPRALIQLLTAVAERLQFLDSTLKRIVEQFEDEYPECRPQNGLDSLPTLGRSRRSTSTSSPRENDLSPIISRTAPPEDYDDNLEDDERRISGRISRRASDISLASRSLANEEGRVHRIGQQVRQEVFGKEFTASPEWADESEDISHLRAKFEALSGDELNAQLEHYDSNDKAELVEELIRKIQNK